MKNTTKCLRRWHQFPVGHPSTVRCHAWVNSARYVSHEGNFLESHAAAEKKKKFMDSRCVIKLDAIIFSNSLEGTL